MQSQGSFQLTTRMADRSPIDRVAIITGASSGIGRVTAIALSAAGWKLVIIARRKEALEETAELCKSSTIRIVPGDITDETFVSSVFRITLETFGRLDLLFNNAGISAPQIPIEDLSLNDFKSVFDINVIGTFLCTREAVRIFKNQSPSGGRIINNGSISAQTPRPHSSPYTASKHAITGLTKSTALDGRAHNITCTQIDIGGALTDMARGQSMGALQPNGSVLAETTFDARHVADAIVHIANLPTTVTVLHMNIMSTGMPYVGRG